MVDLCRHDNDCQTIWKSPALDTALTPPLPVEWKAADGVTTLYGQLVLPAGKTEAASVPLIVNPYGGPHAQIVTGKMVGRRSSLRSGAVRGGSPCCTWTTVGRGGGRDFAQAAYHDFGPVQLGDQIAALDQTLRGIPNLTPNGSAGGVGVGAVIYPLCHDP